MLVAKFIALCYNLYIISIEGDKFMKKSVKITISVLAVLAIVLGSLGIHFGYAKKVGRSESYDEEVTSESPLRVGIVSDLQIPGDGSLDSHQYKSSVAALTMLRDRGIDALLIAGDFTDLGTKEAWGTFEKIYADVFGEDSPIKLFTMGNHDYWLDYFIKCGEVATPAKMQKRFTKATGEYPLSHKTIGGYHFIQWGSLNGTYDKCNSNEKWIRAEIEKAIADDPTKPVFVTTHLAPTNTVYGSENDWGSVEIRDVLSDYPQVVSISAHSHFPIADERSIWQGEFTAFSTQTLDYTCINVEQNRFNAVNPLADAYGNDIATKVPACLYMEVRPESVTLSRLEATTGRELKAPWVIEAPFGADEGLSKYTPSRADSNEAPQMSADSAAISDITDKNGSAQKMITFAAGTDDDVVHSYKLSFLDEGKQAIPFEDVTYDGEIKRFDADGSRVWSDSENYDSAKPQEITELYYYSDYFLGAANASQEVSLRLPKTMPQNAKYVSITAVDCWNAESEPAVCEIN